MTMWRMCHIPMSEVAFMQENGLTFRINMVTIQIKVVSKALTYDTTYFAHGCKIMSGISISSHTVRSKVLN